MSLLTYKYYDTPEGQDIYKKVFVTSKYAALTGLASATLDVLMFSHPKGFVNTTGRYMFYIGPLVGMASAFTVTTNVAQNIRNKNDGINYFLGGIAAGAVFGAWLRSVTVGVPAAVVLGAVGFVKKSGVDNGWTFMPQMPPSATKTIKSAKHDWTVVKDIEELKTWTTDGEYSNQHVADIHFVYGLCNSNANRAVTEYARMFPNRPTPNARTFVPNKEENSPD